MQGYRTYAWGKDHLKPISKTHQTWSVTLEIDDNTFNDRFDEKTCRFNLGLTLIDSLDTMLVSIYSTITITMKIASRKSETLTLDDFGWNGNFQDHFCASRF